MRSLSLTFLALAGALCVAPASAQVNPFSAEHEHHTRKMVMDAGAQLLREKNYQLLDKLAEDYRRGRNRTLSGIWHLGLFHDGIKSGTPTSPTATEADWQQFLQLRREWADAMPKSPSANIALAYALRSKAWWHRGAGYVDTVSEEGWKHYFKHLKEAAQVLDAGKSFAALDPEWFNARLAVALDLADSEVVIASLFKEAVAMEPFYLGTYFTVAKRMLPKWGGSYHQLDAWARAMTKNVELAEGRSLFARILWVVWESNPEFQFEFLERAPETWQQMKLGMRDMNERYPSMWNTRQFLTFACRMRDQELFKAQWSEHSRQMSGTLLLMVRDAPVDYVTYCTDAWNHDAVRRSRHTGQRIDRKL